ncbi:Ribonuclease H-like domain [Cinara cedri]|uniref:RNA-directed DNA polymerase n=1 Tax=Cinara cedri TaxID=506608 RepID=A0A5E4NP06_9HEMI|nr:Ribonuclease H-like domain [Cinara cedri]
MNKELNKILNNRIKRMRVSLMTYNLKVEYCPGKYSYVADLLSRNYKQKIKKTDDTLKDIVHIMEVVNLKFKNNKESEFKKAILEDITLKLVEQYVREGWPKQINSVGDIRHYHKIRNELMLEKGLIYYGCRLVVPRVMCKYIFKKLHESHLGINKTLKKSKLIFFWPGMASDITNAIRICETCIKFSIKKIKEQLKQHERPSVPFHKVGLDIAEIFVADNNPCGSQEYITFATQWRFEVILSSPYYAKSNGLAEKAEGIAKEMITKARYEKKDLNLFLLNYRNSPVAGLEYSPAQLLMARELKTLTNFLNPNIFKPKLVNCVGEMQTQENYQKHFYDKTAGPEEKQFTESEKVYIYDKFKK